MPLQLRQSLSHQQRFEVINGLSNAIIAELMLTARQYSDVSAEECIPLLNAAVGQAHKVLLKSAEIQSRLDEV